MTDLGAFWGWPKKSDASAKATVIRIYSVNDSVNDKDLLEPIQQRIARTALVGFQDMIWD